MLYRIKQFFRAFFALPLNSGERSIINQYLSPEQATCFFAMSRCDQRHCLNVMRTAAELLESETMGRLDTGTKELLIRCCLLHDIGRGSFMGPFSKTYAVLLNHYVPVWARSHGQKDSCNPLFRLLYRYYQHPNIGASMLSELGAFQEAGIIALHHGDDMGELSGAACLVLQLLKEADGKN